MAKAPATIEEAHLVILRTAADLANKAIVESSDIGSGQIESLGERGIMPGEIFRADPTRSNKGGLCLSIDELVVKDQPQEFINDLHVIGVRAIKEAIIRYHSDLFVGVIVGEARQGNNYFERFEGENHQFRLF